MNDQQPPHSVGVSGVITDDHGRALLIQRRDNHHWEPPGGVLELAEAIEDGLIGLNSLTVEDGALIYRIENQGSRPGA
jgi:8-oxo-dGTP pyrophosphatase MutT (NUDIX family)